MNRRQISSYKKYTVNLRLVLFFPFHCCFAGSLRFFCFSSTVKQTKLFHSISEMFFIFLREKNFSLWMPGKRRCKGYYKRWEFWHKTHTPLWLLIGRIIVLTREKTSFAILIGRIIFFTFENHRSLPWLAKTNLRTKIYDIAFWWVFLSMYIINKSYYGIKQVV